MFRLGDVVPLADGVEELQRDLAARGSVRNISSVLSCRRHTSSLTEPAACPTGRRPRSAARPVNSGP